MKSRVAIAPATITLAVTSITSAGSVSPTCTPLQSKVSWRDEAVMALGGERHLGPLRMGSDQRSFADALGFEFQDAESLPTDDSARLVHVGGDPCHEVTGAEAGLLLVGDGLDHRRCRDGLTAAKVALDLELGIRRQRPDEARIVEHRKGVGDRRLHR